MSVPKFLALLIIGAGLLIASEVAVYYAQKLWRRWRR